MFSTATYKQRRNRLKELVGSGLIILPGNEEVGMNYRDNVYHFRQDSTFLYFTGIDQPNLCFIIDIDNDSEILYGDDLTVDQVVWTGPVDSLASFAFKSGIDSVQRYSTISDDVKKARAQKQQVHFLSPYRAEITLRLSEWLQVDWQSLSSKISLPLTRAVISQRAYKTQEELTE